MTATASAAARCLALAALTAAAVLAAAAPSSHAAFPGRDGQVVFSWYSFMESEFAPYPSRTETAIRAAALSDSDATTLRGCTRETGKPDVGDCSIGYGAPAASPNGRRIVFDAGAGLALMRIDGSDLTPLPAQSENDGEPAFSPSGRRLAFSAGPPLSVHHPLARGVWTSDLAGGHAHKVTAKGLAPSWSVRNWIAFLRRDGVYRVRPDGRGLRRLVALHRCTDVDWSPNGAKLAFTCTTPHSGGRLYVADGDGSRRRGIATPYESPDSVAWSPSGRLIAYGSFDGGIQTVHPDGRPGPSVPGSGGGVGATYVIGGGSPTWQPLP
jgi:Tol biopolymer transport system component